MTKKELKQRNERLVREITQLRNAVPARSESDILEDIKKKEEKAAFIARCLRVRVCPKCGDSLGCEVDTVARWYSCVCGYRANESY